MLEYRKCVSCKIDKPCTNEFFYKDKNRYLGLMYRCKECDKKKPQSKKKPYSEFTKEEKTKKRIICKSYSNTKKGKAIHLRKAYQNFDLKKGLQNSITQEDIIRILGAPCTYCGFPSTGFDRIDNSKGHILENCVPACKECNIARMDNFSYEEMFTLGRAIQEIKNNRKININYLVL